MASQYECCVSEMVPVLERLRVEGKIRFMAISERWYLDPRHELLQLAVQDDYFDVMMVGVNLVNQSAVETVLPRAKEHDVGIQGVYAVRGKLAFAESARAVIADAVARGEVDRDEIDPDDPLGFLLEPGVADSLAEACYRFARYLPGVDTVLTGTGNVDHLIENVRSLGGSPLPPDVVARLRWIFARVETVTGE